MGTNSHREYPARPRYAKMLFVKFGWRGVGAAVCGIAVVLAIALALQQVHWASFGIDWWATTGPGE